MPIISSDSSDILGFDDTDILSWNATLTLSSAPSASVHLSNKDEQYSPHNVDLKGTIMEIRLLQNGTWYTIFTGRVKEVRPARDVQGKKMIDVSLSSISEYLAKRPVTTETVNKDGADLMGYILTDYGGLDPMWFNVAADNGEHFEFVTVGEDSVLQAMRKLAEACNVEIFTDNDGVLRTEAKKDRDSTLDYTLGQEWVEAHKGVDSEVFLSTVCRIRGRYLSIRDAAPASQVDYHRIEVMGHSQNHLIARVNVKRDADMTAEQAIACGVSGIDGSGLRAEVIGIHQDSGDMFVRFWKTDGTTFEVGEKNTLEFYVDSYDLPAKELHGGAVSDDSLGEGSTEPGDDKVNLQAVIADVTGKQPKFKRNKRGRQKNRRKDEQTDNRVELTVFDDDLLANVGIRYTDVDNVYIQDEAKALEIGRRALYEEAMAQRVFQVDGPFIPQLRSVNKVVSVPIPYTKRTLPLPSHDTITEKCLLTSVKISFDATTYEAKTSYEFCRLPGLDSSLSSFGL